jgi:hypothetical protein
MLSGYNDNPIHLINNAMQENIRLPEDIDDEGTVCPACAAFIGNNEVFCPSCRAPISLLSNTDPLQRIQTEGFLYGKAVEAKPKLVVLIGVWALFLPAAFIGAMWALLVVSEGIGSGVVGFMFFWVAVAATLFFLVIIYRVTKNYIKYEPRRHEEMD